MCAYKINVEETDLKVPFRTKYLLPDVLKSLLQIFHTRGHRRRKHSVFFSTSSFYLFILKRTVLISKRSGEEVTPPPGIRHVESYAVQYSTYDVSIIMYARRTARST